MPWIGCTGLAFNACCPAWHIRLCHNWNVRYEWVNWNSSAIWNSIFLFLFLSPSRTLSLTLSLCCWSNYQLPNVEFVNALQQRPFWHSVPSLVELTGGVFLGALHLHGLLLLLFITPLFKKLLAATLEQQRSSKVTNQFIWPIPFISQFFHQFNGYVKGKYIWLPVRLDPTLKTLLIKCVWSLDPTASKWEVCVCVRGKLTSLKSVVL